MSIPSEGHTLPEAYDNHLVHSQRTAQWEEKWKQENQIFKLREYIKLNSTPKDYKQFLADHPGIKGIEFHPVRFEIYWYTAARLLTQMARERLIRTALNEEMDFILMYDDDMILPLDMAQQMLMDMVRHEQITVLAPLAFMRNPPHYAVIYNVVKGYDAKQAMGYYINTHYKNYPKDKLVQCDAVGFGAACVRLDFVREKMQAPYFMSTAQTGEDILFCTKVKEAGGTVFMDTRIKLGHLMNPAIIDEEYFAQYAKDHPEHAPNKNQKGKYAEVDEKEMEAGHKMLTPTR